LLFHQSVDSFSLNEVRVANGASLVSSLDPLLNALLAEQVVALFALHGVIQYSGADGYASAEFILDGDLFQTLKQGLL
jgi:hypothetical protein